MDFELYESQNSKVLLGDNSAQSKESWDIPSEGGMDHNDEYFGWADSLKIDGEKYCADDNEKVCRKRKLSTEQPETGKIKATNAFRSLRDNLGSEAGSKPYHLKKATVSNGRCIYNMSLLEISALKLSYLISA